NPGPQTFTMAVQPDFVSITASDDPGLYYGVQALIQLAQQTGRRWPALIMRDRPALLNRGLMLDVTRGKVPTLDTLKDLVRTLARFRYNQLQLYVEHTFTFASHPEI